MYDIMLNHLSCNNFKIFLEIYRILLFSLQFLILHPPHAIFVKKIQNNLIFFV